MKKISLFSGICCLLYPLFVSAVELSDQVTVNGFGTLGATKTTNDTLGFRPNISDDNVTFEQWNLASRSLAGVQMNVAWDPQWSSAIQLVHQKRVENSLQDSIQLATVSYLPTPEWAIRIGRHSPRVYMLTDTRNVGYGYLWTHPPMEFYGQLQTTYIDGLEIGYTRQFDDADMLRATLCGGKTDMWMAYPGYSFEADFGQSVGLTLEFEHQAWTFRGSASVVNNQNQWVDQLLRQPWNQYNAAGLSGAASVADALDTEATLMAFYSLGIAYNDQNWIIQSELSRLNAESKIVPDTVAGYLSIGRHINEFTPYIMYSRIHTSSSDYSLPADVSYYAQYSNQLNYLANTSLLFLNSRFDQEGVAAGVRWDINSHLALKTQWDRKFISAGGNHLWWNTGGTDSSVEDIFTINLDFVF
jgi:hypothetical protein